MRSALLQRLQKVTSDIVADSIELLTRPLNSNHNLLIIGRKCNDRTMIALGDFLSFQANTTPVGIVATGQGGQNRIGRSLDSSCHHGTLPIGSNHQRCFLADCLAATMEPAYSCHPPFLPE